MPARLQGRSVAACLLAGLLLALGGCESESAEPAVNRPEVAAGDARISGIVRFEGTPPPPAPLGEHLCGDQKKSFFDESIAVSPDGALANVIVFLEDGPNVATSPEPQTLDQAGCQYVPHVSAVRVGQLLQVKSSDPTLHNAHADKSRNKPFNLAFTDAGQVKEVRFTQPELAVRVRCDVHQWMNAYVAVFDHPFFAVTDVDGSFELKDVPAGTYNLVAWHERFGQKTQQVVVQSASATTAGFVFGQ